MIAAELARLLAANVPGLIFDEYGSTGNVFIGAMPSAPDLAIRIAPYGGPEPDRWFDTPSVQFWIRGDQGEPRAASDLADAIYTFLRTWHGRLGDGTYVAQAVPVQSGPIDTGVDVANRSNYRVNVLLSGRVPAVA